MRPKNAKNALKGELEQEIARLYHHVMAHSSADITYSEVCRRISVSPASRYFIPYREAREYAEARSNGVLPDVAYPQRKALLEDFYEKLTSELSNTKRHDTLKTVIIRTLNSPAPSLGRASRTIQNILNATILAKRS